MAIQPAKSVFNKLKKQANFVPLFTKFKANEDVLSIYSKVRGKNSFILHSSMADKSLGRYSFIGFDPFLTIKSKNKDVYINGKHIIGNPIKILKKKLSFFKSIRHKGLPLYFGGAVGYFSYETAHFFEKLPRAAKDDINSPDIYFSFFDKSIIYDHFRKEMIIVVLGNDYDKLPSRLLEIKNIITRELKPIDKKIQCGALRSNFSKERYIEAINKIKEYIKAGDTFQVNLSQRLKAEISGDPLTVYKNLVKINPSPFSALLEFDDIKIISSSPERLVRLENGIINTRPIAGTRPRGKTRKEGLKLEKELLGSEKERAEHTMLVDLERNDIGKVCDYGSVRLTEAMSIEKYSHVMHLVSNIRGNLHKSKDRFDLLKAVFPGGTITGCPKIRTMEIIDELEPNARGPYTGSLGYFNFSGGMDFNIIIRTLIMKGNKIYTHAGGGIVADSIPEEEYKETLYKAQAMIKAVEYKGK